MSDWNEFEGNSQGQYNGDVPYAGDQNGAYAGDQNGAYAGEQYDTYAGDQYQGDAFNAGQPNDDPFAGNQFNGGTYFDPNAMPNQNDMPNQNKGNGMAIASLVLGILGIVTCCCSPWLELVLGILAVVFGIKGRQHEEGNSMATAGLVLGIITLVLAVANGAISIIFSFMFGDDLMNEIMNGYYYYY